MKGSILCGCALLLSIGSRGWAQLPGACRLPPAVAQAPAGTSSAGAYDAAGAWFAERGEVQCAATAFRQAIRLEPHLAEAHFDLGLVWQSQGKQEAAVSEFRLALQYDPALLQAHCALGSSLATPSDAEAEFQKALGADPNLVCALDGMAQVLVEQRRYAAALHYWQLALQIDPNASDLQIALATATYKAAKARQADGIPALDGAGVTDAIRRLTDLLKKHPELTAAHFELGNIYANERREREAADEYREVIRHNPGDTLALAAEIRALIDASAYAEALEPARDYARRNPEDPSGHVMLGTIYQQLGDYARAEPELAMGAVKAPDSFEARYQLGLVLARMGKPDQALPELQKAVALKPGDRSAQYQLIAVLRSLGHTDEVAQMVGQLRKEQGSEQLNSQLTSEGTQANDLLQSGKAAEAAEIYRQMLQQEPSSAWTAYNLALALEQTGDIQGAQDALHTALTIEPKLARAQAELGRLELAAGNLAEAEKWLASAVDLDPELIDARGNLAMLYAKKGDLLRAEKGLRQALVDNPEYKEGHLNLGLVLAQQNRKAEAEQEFARAVALAPKDPPTLSTVGKAEMQMGKTEEGVAHLRQVVALAPDVAAAHLDLALALADSYNLPAALEQTTEAVRLAPQSGIAHSWRGRILYDLGRRDEAQAEFETACRLNDHLPEPRYFLALIDKQEGQYDRAISLLQETVRLQPENAMAWYILGQSLQHQSSTAEAQAAWRRAIEIDPDFTQALFSLAQAVRSTDQAEARRLMARYVSVQKGRQILDQADTLANNAVEAAAAHDWPAALQQMHDAITACGECQAKAELYRKLGIIECQAGELDKGERQLLAARELDPADPVTQAALELVATAMGQASMSPPGKIR